MSGLIDTTTGLRFGDGLHFEPGLGSAGLTIPEEQSDTILFAGTGSLQATLNQLLSAQAAFSGASSVNIATFVTGAQLDQANFAGTGNLAALVANRLVANTSWVGNSTLSFDSYINNSIALGGNSAFNVDLKYLVGGLLLPL